MTTPPIVSITDELIAELEVFVSTPVMFAGTVRPIQDAMRALLAERAELKRDAERYLTALKETIAQIDGNIRPTVRDCVNGMNDVQDIYDYCDQIEAAIDAAMQS